MSRASAAALVSEEDFLSLPESLDKIELIDGEVVVSPSPSPRHQTIVLRLIVALKHWADAQKGPIFIGHAPLDVRVNKDRIVQPDVFVIFKDLAHEEKGPIREVPALCIEVLSQNRMHDRLTKRFIYGNAGVKEYWVIDPAGRIERFSGDGLASREEIADLQTALLPGFVLAGTELFE
jgi:Uma2 family endonuclease